MDFQNSTIKYEDVEKTVLFLKEKNVNIDENLIFDQYVNLKKFLSYQDSEYFKQDSNKKICDFFNSNTNVAGYSEMLKIVQYFFSIPGHNANCERIFSLIGSQWSDERNRLTVETVKHLITVKFNMKGFTCTDFLKYLLMPANSKLLEHIGSSEKYDK